MHTLVLAVQGGVREDRHPGRARPGSLCPLVWFQVRPSELAPGQEAGATQNVGEVPSPQDIGLEPSEPG